MKVMLQQLKAYITQLNGHVRKKGNHWPEGWKLYVAFDVHSNKDSVIIFKE